MKKTILPLVMGLLFILPSISLAQLNQLPFRIGGNIPFIGKVGIVEIVVGVMGGIFGYILGTSIKSGLKYIGVFILFMVVLVFFGIMQTDMLARIVDIFVAIKPLIPDIVDKEMLHSASLPLIGFVAGFAYGAVKG